LTARARLTRELAWVLAGTAAIAGLAFGAQRLFFSRPVTTPDIPRSLDEGLAPLMVGQVRAENRLVETPAVTEAMSAIVERLAPAGAEAPTEAEARSRPAIEVFVIDSPVINAFTLPGGIVCVYAGLMKSLASAEEMAAILAHEMAHAAFRDPLVQLARRVGMASIASLLTGGQGGNLAHGILAEAVSLRYGRQAEDRADELAVDLLARAGIDPESYASALSHIKGVGPRDPKLLRYLDPHSPIDERIASAERRAKIAAAAGGLSSDGLATRRIAVDWEDLVKALPSVLEPTD
jgi:predicted Zn-dependent protease